jgi:hypothetical protein
MLIDGPPEIMLHALDTDEDLIRPELVWGFRCQADFIVCVPDLVGSSIAPVAARWHDCGERVEVEIDDVLKGFGGDTIAQAVRQRVMPGGILGLQRDQLGDGVVPTLGSGPSVRRPAVTDLGERLLGLAADAISSLSFGVAEGVLAIGLATCGHAPFSVT